MRYLAAALAMGIGLLATLPAVAAEGEGATTTDAPPGAPFGVPASGEQPFDPNFNPGLDSGLPDIPQVVGAPATPDYKPPAIDAYVDLALTHSDVSKFTFSDTATGYRLIAGFMLDTPVFDQLHVAPEVGYLHIGRAHDQQSTSVNNQPIPQYVNTTTITRTVDMSTLQFDIRGSYPLGASVDGYARVGMHFYHLARLTETVLTYTPIAPNTTPRDADPQQASSGADIGIKPFGVVGLSIRLGKVPSLYAEYGTYQLGGSDLNVAAFGFLLNF